MTNAPKLLIVLLAAAAPVPAQQASPVAAPSTDTSSIILAPKAAEPAKAPASRAAASPGVSSPEINAAISSGVPAYSNREVPASKTESAPKDQRDGDKPKNDIPRLPLSLMSRYVVRGYRLPVFRNVDLYTREGLIDLSFKDHPGLRIGNFFNLNSGLAFEAALKDQRTADRSDLTDTAYAMAVGGDSSEAVVLQDSIIDESFKAGTQDGPVAVGPDPR